MARRSHVQAGAAGLALSAALVANPGIAELRLHKTELGDRTAGSLLTTVRKHPGITAIDLSENSLGGDSVSRMAGPMRSVSPLCLALPEISAVFTIKKHYLVGFLDSKTRH